MKSDSETDTGSQCPICAAPVAQADEFLPFCSDRCRTIDLGKWLKGDYIISRPIEQRDIVEGE